MRSLKFEAEVVQISIYCNIIVTILIKHKELSVNKLLFFAYIIRKERYMPNKIYNGNNTQDTLYKCISLISGDFVEYCNSIEFILKAIHLLEKNRIIFFENNQLRCLEEGPKHKVIYEENLFIEKAIEFSKKISDKQFMREVIQNV
ncbi:hypothetical protein SFC23_17065 [Shouchella clausii]|uniref:hypothetical protein n=1 Tax=Shouchella clausii TaxID=79880 RepID=UPI0039830095